MKIFRIWNTEGVLIGRFHAHAVEAVTDGSLHGYDAAKVPNPLWCFRAGAYGGWSFEENVL